MIDNTQYLSIVQQSGLFNGVPENQHAIILNRGKVISFKPGELVFRSGDPARLCLFVLEGYLKHSMMHLQGKEAICRYLNPGDITAVSAVFGEKKFRSTAEAVGDVKLMGWDKATINELLLEYAPLAINLLHGTINLIHELQDRFLGLCAEQVEIRLANALLRIMKESGRKTSEGVLINFRFSRQELADYTGTTLYTVSRILSSWGKYGWIKSERERITIIDPLAITRLAESD